MDLCGGPPPRSPMAEGAVQPLWQALVAGCSGGVLNALVGHPLDTLKTRAQRGGQQEGGRSQFSGLFDGIAGVLVGVVPFWMAFYFGYK